MKTTMFQKAKYLKVEKLAEAENFIRFRVFGEKYEAEKHKVETGDLLQEELDKLCHEVEFKYQNYELIKICNCTFATQKPAIKCDACKDLIRQRDCSHILACTNFLINFT